MPTKSNKKKSHTGLIILIIAGSILLLTAIILLITRPWNNNNSETSSSFGSNKNTPIKVDDQLVDKIKEHKYQPLKDTRSYSLVNRVNTYEEGINDDSYTVQVPNNWVANTKPDFEGWYRSKDKIGYFVLKTEYAFDMTYEPEKVDSADYYSPQTAMDRYIIMNFSLYGSYEIIDEFTKNINGHDFLCVSVKATDISGNLMYKFIYCRLLDKGTLVPSYLVASMSFDELLSEANKKTILEDIYDLEDTIGGFDESKQ